MSINLKDKLDFTVIDLTAPDKVIKEYLAQISDATDGIVLGKIDPYTGPVQSYVRKGLASSLSIDLATSDKHINIQNDLGAKGEETKKFECYIYTPIYDHYKYKLFFVKYGVANYPVRLIIEQSIADSIPNSNSNYIFECDNRETLETLLDQIFSSKRLVSIIQEIIRIYQAKKDDTSDSLDDEENDEEDIEEYTEVDEKEDIE